MCRNDLNHLKLILREHRKFIPRRIIQRDSQMPLKVFPSQIYLCFIGQCLFSHFCENFEWLRSKRTSIFHPGHSQWWHDTTKRYTGSSCEPIVMEIVQKSNSTCKPKLKLKLKIGKFQGKNSSDPAQGRVSTKCE